MISVTFWLNGMLKLVVCSVFNDTVFCLPVSVTPNKVKRHKTVALMSKNNDSACPERAFCVLVHFFAVLVLQQQREMIKF